MTQETVKKRFIAGAVCPKCSKMDTVMMYTLNGEQHRECIECGFADVLHIQAQPKELRTRVNATTEFKQRDAPEPIQIKGFESDKPSES